MKPAAALLVFAAVVAGTPPDTVAQPSKKVHRVGVLGVASASTYARQVQALRQGLGELGYIEGKNLTLEFRWANHDPARLPELAAELVRSNPDLIVSSGPATAVLKRATQTIPIVMAVSTNAVEAGLVASLARPGGNITGSSSFAREFQLKRLELLKQALPRLQNVGLLLHSSSAGNPAHVEAIRGATRSMDARLSVREVRGKPDLAAAFGAFAQERADAVLVGDHTVFVAAAAEIAELGRVNRIPVAGFAELAESGGLMGYGADFPALWHRAATFVDRILKGANPADLPVEQPMKFEFLLNLKTAKALGLRVPQSTVLRADRLIE